MQLPLGTFTISNVVCSHDQVGLAECFLRCISIIPEQTDRMVLSLHGFALSRTRCFTHHRLVEHNEPTHVHFFLNVKLVPLAFTFVGLVDHELPINDGQIPDRWPDWRLPRSGYCILGWTFGGSRCRCLFFFADIPFGQRSPFVVTRKSAVSPVRKEPGVVKHLPVVVVFKRQVVAKEAKEDAKKKDVTAKEAKKNAATTKEATPKNEGRRNGEGTEGHNAEGRKEERRTLAMKKRPGFGVVIVPSTPTQVWAKVGAPQSSDKDGTLSRSDKQQAEGDVTKAPDIFVRDVMKARKFIVFWRPGGLPGDMRSAFEEAEEDPEQKVVVSSPRHPALNLFVASRFL